MPAQTKALPFPGRVIAPGSADTKSVRAIQKRLNVTEDGVFSAETLEAVELFQARSVDGSGQPLKIDGRVGPGTWAALFKTEVVAQVAAPTPLLAETLRVAGAEVGIMEDPPGSNRGPRVNQYLASVGLNATKGDFAWCAAFVYFCVKTASTSLGVANPLTKTAGALDLWNKATHRVLCAEATDAPGLVRPGSVFVIATGGVHGHVGLVESVEGTLLTTIEGNTNDGGSREGVGVFRRKGRRIDHINRGFVEYL